MKWLHWKERSKARERELDEEIQADFALEIQQRMEAGATREEAEYAARRDFGNVTRVKEVTREMRGWRPLEWFWQDARFALRTMFKNRGFFLTVVLTLALGIGTDTAIFSVVNGVLLNPLPYPHANRVVCLFEEMSHFDQGPISYPNFLDWQRMNNSFSAIAAYRSEWFYLSGESEPEHLQGEMISAGFFKILGVKPIIGRMFKKSDDRLGAAPVAIISENLWKRKFGAKRNVIGQRLITDGIGRTIVGVIPSTFRLRMRYFGGVLNDIYTPIGEFNEQQFYANRGGTWSLAAIGRLKRGITLEQARQDMDRVSRQLAANYPDVDSKEKANLIPLKDEIVGDMRPVLFLLFGAVSLVLLIACVNVANLLLARSTSRRREFAIRLAVGAGHMRVVRQVVTESVLLALIGGGLGLFLAKFGMAAAIDAVPETLPRAASIGLDLHVLLFTLFVSLATGIIFGLAPAWKLQCANIGGALKEGGRSVAGMRNRTQRVFVVVEIALALMLLVGAGLMIRTLLTLWNVSPGFNPHGVITFFITPQPSLAEQSPAAIRAFFRQTRDQLVSTSGVEAASLTWAANPMRSFTEGDFWVAGRPKPTQNASFPKAFQYVVQPGYLKALQIPLKRGRFLTDRDNKHSPAVVVIDESLAKEYFPGREPIGQYLDLNTDPSDANIWPVMRIVGVVGHVNQWGLGSDAPNRLHAEIYLPDAQIPDAYMRDQARGLNVFVRGKGGRLPSFGMLRERLLSLNRGLVAFDSQPMEHVILTSIASQRFTMSLFAVFAGLALFLASIGIYGVLSYFVGQRRQEIGVRMALGAAPTAVLRMILKEGARMIVTGIAAGVIASLGLAHLMSNMLFGVKPTDLPTFVLVVIALSVIGLLACYLPARRAMRIDPVIALRNE